MENNKKTAPEIRFLGYTDPWEQRKLLGCIEKITDFRGRTPKKLGMDWSESGYLALSALNVKDGYIDFNQDVHYGDQKLYDKWMSGNELHKGQVLFTTEAPMGNVAQVPDDRCYILSQRTIAFDVDKSVITESFLATVLRTPGVQSALSSLSSGGTAKGVSQKTLNEVYITIPNNTEEQESIATLFIEVDNLITLHQRKCDELKNYKKGLLQQMFPQPGESFPRVRFPGFTDPWEQRKFKDLFRERREKTTVEDEDILLSCAITGIYLNSELFGHQRGRSNIGYLKIKMNDLILSAQNLHLGNANVNKRFEHGIISPAYKVYEITDCNPDFIQAWVKQESTKKFFLDVTTEGASQCRKNIDWNMLANSTIPVPSEREQSVLGSFITVLDNAITLHQRKCDELESYKKGLLQKLFV